MSNCYCDKCGDLLPLPDGDGHRRCFHGCHDDEDPTTTWKSEPSSSGGLLTLDIMRKAMEQAKNAQKHDVQDPESEQPGF